MEVLIVDDHPLILEGYETALSRSTLGNGNLKIYKAHDCESAVAVLEKAAFLMDVVLIDFSLPGYQELQLLNGGDLATYIRKKNPYCRVIICTAHTEIITIYNIVKRVRPDGMVTKNDLRADNIAAIVHEVAEGNIFQGPTVLNCINEIWKKELMVEDFNRQILYYLSKGFKIRELSQNVSLTTSAIQKRIIRMKKAFDVEDDSGLLREVMRQGFL